MSAGMGIVLGQAISGSDGIYIFNFKIDYANGCVGPEKLVVSRINGQQCLVESLSNSLGIVVDK